MTSVCGLADVADAVLAQLPAAEPVGYRLLIHWRCSKAAMETVFEAVAVTAAPMSPTDHRLAHPFRFANNNSCR